MLARLYGRHLELIARAPVGICDDCAKSVTAEAANGELREVERVRYGRFELCRACALRRRNAPGGRSVRENAATKGRRYVAEGRLVVRALDEHAGTHRRRLPRRRRRLDARPRHRRMVVVLLPRTLHLRAF